MSFIEHTFNLELESTDIFKSITSLDRIPPLLFSLKSKFVFDKFKILVALGCKYL